LQSFLGVTKSELLFAIIIISALLAGLIIRLLLSEFHAYSTKNIDAVYRAIDSLAETEKTSYTGYDLEGNKVGELVAGDTIVKQESNFGYKKKKMLPGSKININTAMKDELMMLPGIGSATADKIIATRQRKRFGKPSDIKRVKGIGRKKYNKLKKYIVVR
jgi:competence ComEA-like helix-hairpin-helix protein